MQGLKGLKKEDRAAWEQKYSDLINDYEDLNDDDLDRLYKNTMFKEKFGNFSNYDSLKTLSPEERDAYYDEYDKVSQQEVPEDAEIITKDSLQKSNEFSVPEELPDTMTAKSDATAMDNAAEKEAYAKEMAEKFQNTSEAYKQTRAKYDDVYAKSAYHRVHGVKDLKEKADKISSYYKKYKDTERIQFDDSKWEELAKTYASFRDSYGEEQADMMLESEIRDEVSKNQPLWEKTWFTVTGGGAMLAGSMAITAGIVKGLLYDGNQKALANNEEETGLTDFEAYLDGIIDNDWTRFGNEITETGSLLKANQELARSYATESNPNGLSNSEIVQKESDINGSITDQIFNINTPFAATQSWGFSAASAAVGGTEGYVAEQLFGLAAKKGVQNIAKTGVTGAARYKATKEMLEQLNKIKSLNTKVVNPAFVAGVEAVSEGLQTKISTYDEGKKLVDQRIAASIDRDFENLMKTEFQPLVAELFNKAQEEEQFQIDSEGRPFKANLDPKELEQRINAQAIEILYEKAANKWADKYQQDLKQVEFAAAIAGIQDAIANEILGAGINVTAKTALQHKSVQKAFEESALNKKIEKFKNWIAPKYNVVGENAIEANNKGWGRVAANTAKYVKEMGGEFLEEGTQTSFSNVTQAGATQNITDWLSAKYDENATVNVGDTFGNELNAAVGKFISAENMKESFVSGVYGAIGSVVGSPVANTSKFNTNRVKGFSDLVSRIPVSWHSGVRSAYQEIHREHDERTDMADRLNEWLARDENKNKFQSITGASAWAERMDKAAENEDEFGYRNSDLGKTVNDAFMLQELKGTKLYDSWMNKMVTAAYMEEESEDAQKIIAEAKKDVNSPYTNMSDEQIFSEVKKSANKVIDTIQRVEEEIENTKSIFNKNGREVDYDTLQTIVYGKLQMEDWDKRHQQITSELEEATKDIQNSDAGNRISLTGNDKKIIAKYGNLKNALKEKQRIEEKLNKLSSNEELSKLKESSKSIREEIKKLSKKEGAVFKNKLKEKQNSLKEIEAKIAKIEKPNKDESKKLNKDLSLLENLTEEDVERKETLTESEIMELPDNERALMLDRNNLSQYSAKQQAIINNLLAKATAKNANFEKLVADASRIYESNEKFNDQYFEAMRDPSGLQKFKLDAQQAISKLAVRKVYESIANKDNYADFAKAYNMAASNTETPEAFNRLEQFMHRYAPDYLAIFNDNQKLFSDMHDNAEYDDQRLYTELFADYCKDKGLDFSSMSNEDIDNISTLQDFKDYADKYLNSYNAGEEHKIEPKEYSEITDVVRKLKQDAAESEAERAAKAGENGVQANLNPASTVVAQTIQSSRTEPEKPTSFTSAVNDLVNKITSLFSDNQNSPLKEVLINRISDLLTRTDISDTAKTNILETLNELLTGTSFNKKTFVDDLRNYTKGTFSQRVTADDADAKKELKYYKLLIKKLNEVAERAARTSSSPVSEDVLGASIMPALDMESIIAKNSPEDKPLIDFYNQHNIKGFINSGALNNDKDIYYIAPSDLNGHVVAVTEVSSDVPTAMAVEINGETKYYQPVAILPQTNDNSNIEKLNETAKNSGKSDTILTVEGTDQPLTSKVSGFVGTVTKAFTRRLFADTMVMDELGEDAKDIKSLSPVERAKDPKFKNAVKKLVEKFTVVKDAKNGQEVSTLRYKALNSAKDSKLLWGISNGLNFWTFPNSNKKEADGSSKSFIKLLTEGSNALFESSLISYSFSKTQTRINDLSAAMEKYKDKLDGSRESKLEFVNILAGTSSDPNVSQKKDLFEFDPFDFLLLNGKTIRINIAGWNDDGPILEFLCEEAVSKEVIARKSIKEFQEDSAKAYKEFLLDVLMPINDEGKRELPTYIKESNDGKEYPTPFDKINIDYDDFRILTNDGTASYTEDQKNMALDKIARLFADNSIYIPGGATVSPTMGTPQFVSPFAERGSVNVSQPITVANPGNANINGSSKPISPEEEKKENNSSKDDNDPKQADNGEVINQNMENSINVLNTIFANSPRLELNADESGYVKKDSEGNETDYHVRVTTVEGTSSTLQGENKPFEGSKASSPIGSAVDDCVRTLIEEPNATVSDKEFEKYTSISKNGVMQKIQDEVRGDAKDEDGKRIPSLKEKLVEVINKQFGGNVQNVHIMAKEFRVSGVLKNDKSQVKVAGTTDLIVVDDKGNVYIFDMKTYKTDDVTRGNPLADPNEKYGRHQKYNVQLAIYKECLEQMARNAGIQNFTVKGVGIVPFALEYKADKNSEPSETDKYAALSKAAPAAGSLRAKMQSKSDPNIYVENVELKDPFMYTLTDSEGKATETSDLSYLFKREYSTDERHKDYVEDIKKRISDATISTKEGNDGEEDTETKDTDETDDTESSTPDTSEKKDDAAKLPPPPMNWDFTEGTPSNMETKNVLDTSVTNSGNNFDSLSPIDRRRLLNRMKVIYSDDSLTEEKAKKIFDGLETDEERKFLLDCAGE